MYARAGFQTLVIAATCALATAKASATADEAYVLSHDGVAMKEASGNGMHEPGKAERIIRSQHDTLDKTSPQNIVKAAPNYEQSSLAIIRNVPKRSTVASMSQVSNASVVKTEPEEKEKGLIHDSAYADWGHSAGYVTDYLIAATCLVCLMVPRVKRQIPYITEQFVWLMVLEGAAFAFAGVAHSRIDAYHHAGLTMGTTMGDRNTGWMYPWLLSQVCTGFFSAATITFSYCAFPMGFFGAPSFDAVPTVGGLPVGTLAYLVGAWVSWKEMHIMKSGDTSDTGKMNGYWSLASTVLSLLNLGVGLYNRGDRKGMWFPHHPPGHLIAFFGTALMLPAFFLRANTPPSCWKTGAGREDCPYPEEFNQNAIFHSLVMASILGLACSVWVKFEAHKPTQTRRSPMQKDRRQVNQWFQYFNDFLMDY